MSVWKDVFIFLVILLAITVIINIPFNITGNIIKESPSEKDKTNKNSENDVYEKSKNITNSYGKLRWESMPLTYSFGENCVGPIIDRLHDSFDILENRTNSAVRFREVEKEGNLEIFCHEEKNIDLGGPGPDYYFTQGEAQITDIRENKIKGAKIEFWQVTDNGYPKSCYNFPKLELHEILHVFGFEHNEENHYSIMYPYSRGCISEVKKKNKVTILSTNETFYPDDKVDDSIIKELISTYS